MKIHLSSLPLAFVHSSNFGHFLVSNSENSASDMCSQTWKQRCPGITIFGVGWVCESTCILFWKIFHVFSSRYGLNTYWPYSCRISSLPGEDFAEKRKISSVFDAFTDFTTNLMRLLQSSSRVSFEAMMMSTSSMLLYHVKWENNILNRLHYVISIFLRLCC